MREGAATEWERTRDRMNDPSLRLSAYCDDVDNAKFLDAARHLLQMFRDGIAKIDPDFFEDSFTTLNDFIAGGPLPKLKGNVFECGSNEHLLIDFGTSKTIVVKPHNGRLESRLGVDDFLRSFIVDVKKILDQLSGVEYAKSFGVAPEWEK